MTVSFFTIRIPQSKLATVLLGLGVTMSLVALYFFQSKEGLHEIHPVRRIYASNRPYSLALSPNGRLIAIGTWGEKKIGHLHDTDFDMGDDWVRTPSIEFWNADDGKIVKRLPIQPPAKTMLFSPDGASVISAGGRARLKEEKIREDKHLLPAGHAQLREMLVNTGAVTFTDDLPWLPVLLRLSHDGKLLALYGCAQGKVVVRVYEYPHFKVRFETSYAGIVPVTYEPEWLLDPMALFGACDFSPNDDVVFIGVNRRNGAKAEVYAVATEDGSTKCSVEVPAGRLLWINSTLRVNELLVSADGGLRRWQLHCATKTITTMQEHVASTGGFFFTDSPNVLVACSGHPRLPCFLFDLVSARSVAVLAESENGPVETMAISNDRITFAASHGWGSNQVTIWRIPSQK